MQEDVCTTVALQKFLTEEHVPLADTSYIGRATRVLHEEAVVVFRFVCLEPVSQLAYDTQHQRLRFSTLR